MKLLLQKRIVLVLLILAAALWLWGATYPFVGIYNTNNNYLSLAAKNYLRFGFDNLKFLPTYYAGEQFVAHDPYYLHHPFLVFLIEAFSFMAFGVHNITVHIPQFFFMAGAMAMIYGIARRLWNQKTALWSLALAAVFPMTSFFWKYMQFEQASMFLGLLTYYGIIRYIARPKRVYLAWIFFAALASGLADWGVLYLLFPFAVLFFTKFRDRVKLPFAAYLAGTIISLGSFLVLVYIAQGGFGELSIAIWARSYTAELISLSYWPIRLAGITLLRMTLYFSPFALVSGVYIFRLIRDRETWGLPEATLVFFFLYGFLNLIFLPTATWGHSYFLFYFIPFFAWSGGLWLMRREKRQAVILLWIVVIAASSILVNYLKLAQVRKQLWKYDVAKQINERLSPYETVGVIHFAGDVFENYFFHPTQPIVYARIADWTNGISYPGVAHAVFVCAGPCTTGELDMMERLSQTQAVTRYEAGENTAWFITKQLHMDVENPAVGVTPSVPATVREDSLWFGIYRWFRDALGVGQI